MGGVLGLGFGWGVVGGGERGKGRKGGGGWVGEKKERNGKECVPGIPEFLSGFDFLLGGLEGEGGFEVRH